MPDGPWDSIVDLVLVTGHAVLQPHRPVDPTRDEAWVLHPYQHGEAPYYIEHVRVGVERAASNPASLLVFSGGQTRRAAGPLSEAQSCFAVAEHFAWWSSAAVRSRATTEEFARDSLENLLFGIARFRECCGSLPRQVTVVGWEFKRRRFELHRAALGFPKERFEYVGANDPPDLQSATLGELELGTGPSTLDPMGARPPLADKRHQRNPFLRQHGYVRSCPELAELLTSPQPLPPSRLPW